MSGEDYPIVGVPEEDHEEDVDNIVDVVIDVTFLDDVIDFVTSCSFEDLLSSGQDIRIVLTRGNAEDQMDLDEGEEEDTMSGFNVIYISGSTESHVGRTVYLQIWIIVYIFSLQEATEDAF